MSKKRRKFADDGWAVWVDGDDTSTVYINDWVNPKGKSYVDMAVRIRGVKTSKSLHVYVPFAVTPEEIEELYKIEPIDAIIKDNTIIPGNIGKTINLELSYKEMKKIGYFEESLIKYEIVLWRTVSSGVT